jgi:carbon-monoxide dehydrogenase medium subunit
MITGNFDYFAPSNIEEAIKLLNEYGDDCKIISGGHSLVPVLKLRLASPAVLIDIGRIKGLKGISFEGDVIVIGANTTHAEIARSADLKKHCPLLVETAGQIGDQQVRNRGTLGGSLTHADPSADWPAAVLALDADIIVKGQGSVRTIKATDFFVDIMTSTVKSNEIVTEIRITKPAQPQAAVYLKVPQAASGFAVVGVAAQLTIKDGRCEKAAIGITGLGPKAYRASTSENALIGNALDAATISAAGEKADTETVDAMEDIHASGEFRRNLTRVYTKRAIMAAMSRA